jgi:hypothetical protein
MRGLLSGLVVSAAVLVLAPVSAAMADDSQPFSTYLYGQAAIFSDPGSYIGKGAETVWTPAFAGVSGFPNSIGVNVTPPQGDSYSIGFGGPSGQRLEPGVYDSVGDDTDRPHLAASTSAGAGCDGSGRFEIKDIAYDANDVPTRLWVLFELHCNQGLPALFGELKLGEPPDDPVLQPVPSIVRWPADNFGTVETPVPVLVVASQPTSISSVAIGGADPQDFRLAQDGCTGIQLAPKDSCSVQVAFDPLVAGTRTAVLQLIAGNGTVHSVPLQGFTYGGTTRLVVNSDSDAGLGAGKSYTFSAAGDTIWALGTPQKFQFGATDSNGGWEGTFQPPTGQELTAGSSWSDVGDSPTATQAAMELEWSDYACSAASGQLQVLSATYNAFGDMTSFDAKFEMRCPSPSGAITGEFDWRAGDAVAAAPWMAADATGAPGGGSGDGPSGGATGSDGGATGSGGGATGSGGGATGSGGGATGAAPAAPSAPPSTTPTTPTAPLGSGPATAIAPNVDRLRALVISLSRDSRRTAQATHLTRRAINRSSLLRARRSVARLQSELTSLRRAVAALAPARRAEAAPVLKRVRVWQATLAAERHLLSAPGSRRIAGPLLTLVSRANAQATAVIHALARLVE